MSTTSSTSSDLESVSITTESSLSVVSLGTLELEAFDEQTVAVKADIDETIEPVETDVVNDTDETCSNESNEADETEQTVLDSSPQNDFLYTPCPSETSESLDSDLPVAPPPSWTSSIEAFIDQLNDFDYTYDHESETFELLEFHGLTALSEDEEENILNEQFEESNDKGMQSFFTYLTVPLLLSQLLMLIIITNASSNSNVNGNSAASLPIIRPNFYAIHHHHHHHHHFHHYYYYSESKNSDGSFTKRFFHIFFNPFSVIANSKFYKHSADWLKEQANDPNSLIGQFFKYLQYYIATIQSQFNKLTDTVRSGLDKEIGNALKIRDNWNKAIYDKIYKVAASPQYKKAVATVSKWASSIKDRIFSSSKNN